jgi:hypothetical protein
MYKNNDGKRVSGSNAAVELRDGERLDLWQTPVNASSLRSVSLPYGRFYLPLPEHSAPYSGYGY